MLASSRIKPNGRPAPGPIGNTTGIILPDTAPNPTLATAPAIKPTPKEKGWWERWGSGAVHIGLDVVGLIPGVGEIADGANALIYLAEGDKVNAALSAAAMIPGAGMAATGAKWGKKAVGVAAEAGVKVAREGAEKTAKEIAEAAAEKAAKEKAEKEAAEAAARKGGKDKGGPCDHLKQGSGTGPYRGGAHSKTSKPRNDDKDSHHAPAKDASPLNPKDGPAIQMDPKDHAKTSSNGQMPGSIDYREGIAELIASGKWREAMLKEIQDIRRVAREVAKDPTKYNEAMLEMLEYFKCLSKNKFLS